MNENPCENVAINFNHVSVELGKEVILEDICLNIERASFHAVFGPNGGGKSTLMRCVLGEISHRGEIHLSSQTDAQIGYVPQNFATNFNVCMTVADFFIMLHRWPAGLGASRKRRQLIENLLSQTGVSHLIDHPMTGLSGGEIKRVLLAQSMWPKPELLLLDEPTSQVDIEGSENMLKLLKGLVNEGTTVVMVSHEIKKVLEYVDHISVVDKRVLFSGSTENFYHRYLSSEAPISLDIDRVLEESESATSVID